MMDEVIYFIEGFKEALNEEKHGEWLVNHFEKNKEEICFEACRWICGIGDYVLCLNGDDDGDMSLIIQEDGDDLRFIQTNEKEIQKDFDEAFSLIEQFIEEDKTE